MAKQPIIQPHILESLCKVIADTSTGLTGSEIGKILTDCKIIDTDPQMTKWKRRYNAFVNSQNRFQDSKGGGLVIGGKLRCVGLVHGTLSDNTGGKFAAVVPSIFIFQTILEMSK